MVLACIAGTPFTNRPRTTGCQAATSSPVAPAAGRSRSQKPSRPKRAARASGVVQEHLDETGAVQRPGLVVDGGASPAGGGEHVDREGARDVLVVDHRVEHQWAGRLAGETDVQRPAVDVGIDRPGSREQGEPGLIGGAGLRLVERRQVVDHQHGLRRGRRVEHEGGLDRGDLGRVQVAGVDRGRLHARRGARVGRRRDDVLRAPVVAADEPDPDPQVLAPADVRRRERGGYPERHRPAGGQLLGPVDEPLLEAAPPVAVEELPRQLRVVVAALERPNRPRADGRGTEDRGGPRGRRRGPGLGHSPPPPVRDQIGRTTGVQATDRRRRTGWSARHRPPRSGAPTSARRPR